MLISEYLSLRGVSVTTGQPGQNERQVGSEGNTFAEELQKQIKAAEGTGIGSTEVQTGNGAGETDALGQVRIELGVSGNVQTDSNVGGVKFSKHAMERLSERNIDMTEGGRLERLNRAVTLAGEKGSDDALVMIDSTAFLVSVRNNKVITAMTGDDMQGNIFTNIDSTVIM